MFITISVLICMVSAGKPAKTLCYDKGIKNIRAEEVKQQKETSYFKCSDREYKHCGEMPYDGCKYILKDGEIVFSSSMCQ